MLEYFEKVQELLAANVPFVSVTIVDTIGSVPQNAGSKMLVVSDGLLYGTVGGGKVEKRAIEEARKFLATARSKTKSQPGSETAEKSSAQSCTKTSNGAHESTEAVCSKSTDDTNSATAPCSTATGQSESPDDTDFVIHAGDSRTRFVNWNLNKDIGMTCGGSVKLYFEVFNTHPWSIAVFGAGHCSNALINMLISLDCRVTCYDTRQEWLDRLPVSPKLKKVFADDLPKKVSTLAPNSFVILMTMGHTSDKPILLEILRNWKTNTYPYLGVIGSKAKAARLKQDIAEAGLPSEYGDLFFCPLGLSIGNNHPQEIAISIVSQLLEERDKHVANSKA